MSEIVSLIFWLLAVPFCIGVVPTNFIAKKWRSPGLFCFRGIL